MVTRHSNALCGSHRALRGCVLLWQKTPVSDADDRISAFHLSKKAPLWFKLMHEHVFPKMTSVTKLAIRLGNAQDVSRQEDAQALKKDRVWQACLDNNTAFLGNLSDAAYFIARGKPQPFSATGTALLAYRELWLELGACPTPGLVKERVEQKLGRKISKSQWYETLGEIRQLFDLG
jgi:hypothetical protein